MPKSNIEKALNEIEKPDAYTVILFALWKIKDIPEYLTLSEISYILDNKSLIDFLDYYGGMTIKVPTKEEFQLVVNALILYECVNIEHMDLAKALKTLGKKEEDIKEIKEAYFKVCEVLADFDFKRE